MTGLNLETDALIEVAVLITDAELNVLDEGISVVIKPDEAALEQMDDFVRDMHSSSGLLPELA
ncbi:oligoribonuclease, partial [Escherichia coli]|nr:oligoribonuclease [Escherichia coli]